MKIDMGKLLAQTAAAAGLPTEGALWPDVVLEPSAVQVMMINEGPPAVPSDYIYAHAPDPSDMKSISALFRDAGITIQSSDDLLDRGIYITTAIKTPKTEYAVDKNILAHELVLLETELDSLPNLEVVMLMGDVAKKAFNMIAKKRTKKNVIPAGSTYKIRGEAYMYDGIRVFPSYVMTGGNILIEKSKRVMVADDIRRMMAWLEKTPQAD